MGVEVCGEVLKLYHKLLGWVLGVGLAPFFVAINSSVLHSAEYGRILRPQTAVGLTHVVPVTQGGI